MVAVALLTYRYTSTDAPDFWHAVAMDDRLTQNDPSKKLHLHIHTGKLGEYPLKEGVRHPNFLCYGPIDHVESRNLPKITAVARDYRGAPMQRNGRNTQVLCTNTHALAAEMGKLHLGIWIVGQDVNRGIKSKSFL
jgi:hypothetical protein